MARFTSTVDSSAALVATAPSGANANALFASLVSGAATGAILRRIVAGVRAGTGAVTTQQCSIAIIRQTARGTATTTQTPQKVNPNSGASAITGVDTAWSAVPTATWTAPYLFELSFNAAGGADIPFEGVDGIAITLASANGLAFVNIGNALPASHLFTLTLVWDE